MTSLKNFIKDKEFGAGESLPKGDTYLSTNAEVKEVETEYEGKKKIRYEIKDDGKTFFVGPKVMQGIQEAILDGFEKVRITKTGEGIKTNYSVVGVKE